jgi:hypothetical protein
LFVYFRDTALDTTGQEDGSSDTLGGRVMKARGMAAAVTSMMI